MGNKLIIEAQIVFGSYININNCKKYLDVKIIYKRKKKNNMELGCKNLMSLRSNEIKNMQMSDFMSLKLWVRYSKNLDCNRVEICATSIKLMCY